MDARRDVLTRLRALIDRSHSQDVTGQVQTRRNSLDTVGISGLPIAKRNASATVAGCSEMGNGHGAYVGCTVHHRNHCRIYIKNCTGEGVT